MGNRSLGNRNQRRSGGLIIFTDFYFSSGGWSLPAGRYIRNFFQTYRTGWGYWYKWTSDTLSFWRFFIPFAPRMHQVGGTTKKMNSVWYYIQSSWKSSLDIIPNVILNCHDFFYLSWYTSIILLFFMKMLFLFIKIWSLDFSSTTLFINFTKNFVKMISRK